MKQERPGIVFLLIILVLFSASVGVLHKRKKIKGGDSDSLFTYRQHEGILKQAARNPKCFLSSNDKLMMNGSAQDVALNTEEAVDH